jgi:hypothetical protein
MRQQKNINRNWNSGTDGQVEGSSGIFGQRFRSKGLTAFYFARVLGQDKGTPIAEA